MTMNVLLVLAPGWDLTFPPLGISFVAAALKEANHQVRVCDYNIEAFCRFRNRIGRAWQHMECWHEPELWGKIEPAIKPLLQDLADELERHSIDAVGFSTFRANMKATRWMMAGLRRAAPGVKVFVGGQGVDHELGTELLTTGLVDAVVLGEGEHSAVALLEAWQRGDPSAPIAGVLGVDAHGSPRFGGHRPQARLDELPDPDFDDLPRDRYIYTDIHDLKGILPVMGSRGCTHRCVYCSEPESWPRYRFRSGSNLVGEFARQSARYGVRDFVFMDSLINGKPAELERFVDHLLATGATYRWGGQARVDPRLGDKLLEKMARAGCSFIIFGLESGSQHVLDLMNKRVDVRDAYPVIRNANKHGIEVHLNIIVGFPGERRRDFLATLRLLLVLRKSISVVSVYRLQLNRQLQMPEEPGQPRVVLGDHVGSAISDDWHLADGSNNFRIRGRRQRVLTRTLKLFRMQVI